MSMHLQREIESLKKMILGLSAMAEESVRKAVQSLVARDADLAQEVGEADLQIDEAEVQVEEECLKILALHQPVAGDLRFIVSVLKINNDLERIGDLAVNIAKRASFLCQYPDAGIPFDLNSMCQKSTEMLRLSLDALMRMDPDCAQEVLTLDDQVDQINRDMYGQVISAIKADPEKTDILLSYLSASRHLERIADYATNIAEDVIYTARGWIVRHGIAQPE